MAQIEEAVELEGRRYRDFAEQDRQSVQEEVSNIANQFSGGLYNSRFSEAHLKGLERRIRERVKERRRSLEYAPALIETQHLQQLRAEISQMIGATCREIAEWLESRGATAGILTSSSGDDLEDEKLRLNGLATSLLRELELEQKVKEDGAKRIDGPETDRPLVFISCGQCAVPEIELGNQMAAAVDDLTPCKGYFAENQNSLRALSDHIFGALNRAVGLVAVMHHRGTVTKPSGSHLRASVWIEQEIGIAAFLAQVQQRNLPVLLYIQKGIRREGVREQLRIKPVEFETEAEVLADFKGQLRTGAFAPVIQASAVQLRATIDYETLKSEPSLHRYRLKVAIMNVGSVKVEDYWIELLFPKAIIDTSGVIGGEEGSRQTETHRFFRTTSEGLKKMLYPGDQVDTNRIEYRMDNELFRTPKVLDQTVDLTLQANGMKPFRLSKKISDLTCFSRHG